ncbi:MAG: 5-aminolevulinate synthase [Albidovulum sp.]|uniref:5-aminolevulinate synthase n=1 Tax=Albidovulum sp. TaxID=1872424 RepID=UPI003CAFA2C0
MTYVLTRPAFLVVTAALAYAIATAGIKWASDAPSPMALLLIIFGFGLATITEVVLLRQADLSVIYIAIITVETLMVLTLAALIGEGLSPKQMLGAAFVLTGIFIVGE